MEIETKEELVARLQKTYTKFILKSISISFILGLIIAAITTTLLITNSPIRKYEVQCKQNLVELRKQNEDLKAKNDVLIDSVLGRIAVNRSRA